MNAQPMKTQKTRVLLLFGGASEEHEVSLQSAAAIGEALPKEKYELQLCGITKEGKWLYYEGDLTAVAENRWQQGRCSPAQIRCDWGQPALLVVSDQKLRELPFDIVFPALHGRYGEDGTLQGLLELAGVPYVGCDLLSSALGMDKLRAHAVADAIGVATPPSVALAVLPGEEALQKAVAHLQYPLFVKPLRGGSSVGITKVQTSAALYKAAQNAFLHDDRVVIEQGVAGVEVGCAVAGNGALLTLGEPDEMALDCDFLGYDEKYITHKVEIIVPARVDAATRRKILDTGAALYRALGCSGLARVDMFLTPAGALYFNEVNTMPGFTAASRYPKMMESAGIDLPDLVDMLVQLGLEKWKK